MKIEIKRIGNRSLYQSLYQDIDRTTRHRTLTGAARSLIKMVRESAGLSRSVGRWGYVEVVINGRTLPQDEALKIFFRAEKAVEDRAWADPVRIIAGDIEDYLEA